AIRAHKRCPVPVSTDRPSARGLHATGTEPRCVLVVPGPVPLCLTLAITASLSEPTSPPGFALTHHLHSDSRLVALAMNAVTNIMQPALLLLFTLYSLLFTLYSLLFTLYSLLFTSFQFTLSRSTRLHRHFHLRGRLFQDLLLKEVG